MLPSPRTVVAVTTPVHFRRAKTPPPVASSSRITVNPQRMLPQRLAAAKSIEEQAQRIISRGKSLILFTRPFTDDLHTARGPQVIDLTESEPAPSRPARTTNVRVRPSSTLSSPEAGARPIKSKVTFIFMLSFSNCFSSSQRLRVPARSVRRSEPHP